jgi:hypothetical protein
MIKTITPAIVACWTAIQLCTLSLAAQAGKADVLDVRVECHHGSCTFNVTVKHADAGWKHYADQWDVLSPDGKILGTRVLYHPHDNEQPFTRSLSGVKIPPEISQVTVRARDSRHGWGGVERRVKLPNR